MSGEYGKRLGGYIERVMAYKTGEFVSLMIHIGDELGLYEAMIGKEEITASGLAETTGLNERWLQEWLRGQGAAGLIDHLGDERFHLPDVAEDALLKNESFSYVGGYFFKPPSHEILDKTIDAFRTGVGVSWGQHGHGASHFLCRSNLVGHLQLPEQIIPLIEGMEVRLSGGGAVMDVGCGSGSALSILAEAFPNSEFVGIDPAANMIGEAKDRYSDIPNVRFETGYGEKIVEKNHYDLITTFDCMHDMTDPDGTMTAVYKALRKDGVWLIKDIRAADTYAENLESPLSTLMYGFSILYCMSSALSKPGGAGLGTLGFPPAVCESMGARAGFSQFRVLDYEQDPFNYYYELRK